jgi:lipooligosaccharide transport system ATP-binding protein
MKRRLTIARALINDPQLLLLDEPTTGLDPQARHLVWERLYSLKRRGVTQVLTTHYMDEAEQLCDRLVIMDGGRIVATGSPRELIATHSTREVVELRFATPEEHDRAGAQLHAADEQVEELADRFLVYAADGDATADRLTGNGLRPAAVLVRRSTLEDVFLHLTGRSLEEE